MNVWLANKAFVTFGLYGQTSKGAATMSVEL